MVFDYVTKAYLPVGFVLTEKKLTEGYEYIIREYEFAV